MNKGTNRQSAATSSTNSILWKLLAAPLCTSTRLQTKNKMHSPPTPSTTKKMTDATALNSNETTAKKKNKGWRKVQQKAATTHYRYSTAARVEDACARLEQPRLRKNHRTTKGRATVLTEAREEPSPPPLRPSLPVLPVQRQCRRHPGTRSRSAPA